MPEIQLFIFLFYLSTSVLYIWVMKSGKFSLIWDAHCWSSEQLWTLSGNKWWVSLMPSHAVILGFRVLEMWFGVAVFCWCVVRVETNAVQFFDFVNDLRFQSFKILAIREPWIAIFQKNSESQNLLWFWILKKIQRTGGFHKGTQQRTSSLG